MDGEEFERFCADILRRHGWTVETTPASGDQGVDLIGTLRGTTVAIQCKRYSASVGNSAVQEVTAGRAHYRCDHAAVVTNSDYTLAAKELAQTTGVLLLHDTELPKLWERLSS